MVAAANGEVGMYPPIHALYASCNSCVRDPSSCVCHPLGALALLARSGARLSHQDAVGQQALHLAALNGHYSVLQALCSLGASPLATNKKGHTALDIVQRQQKFYAGQQLNHPALERYRRCTKTLYEGARVHDQLVALCGIVQAWQRLRCAELGNASCPALPPFLLRRIGEHLETLQLDMFLTGRVVLPVTARANSPNAFYGEAERMATCRSRALARRLDDLGDSELSAEEEVRRATTRREDAAIEASLRQFCEPETGARTLEEQAEAEYRAQKARRERRLARKHAKERRFIATSSDSDADEGSTGQNDVEEDALDRAERLLRERRRPPSVSAATHVGANSRRSPKRRRLQRVLCSSESDSE